MPRTTGVLGCEYIALSINTLRVKQNTPLELHYDDLIFSYRFYICLKLLYTKKEAFGKMAKMKSLVSLPTQQECRGKAILVNAVWLHKGKQAFKPATPPCF